MSRECSWITTPNTDELSSRGNSYLFLILYSVLTTHDYHRYDYEEVDSDSANKVMSELSTLFSSSSFIGESLTAITSTTSFKVAEASNFSYTDPIDHSVSHNQGLYVRFVDGSRIVYRLSGTGSSGATIRVYVEKYSKNSEEYAEETQIGLKPLIEVALSLSKLVEFTGRKEATVITVSYV